MKSWAGKRARRLSPLVLFAIVAILSGCGSSSSSDTEDLGGIVERSGGTGISNTFSSPSEMGVGDILSIDLSGGSTETVSFSGVSSDANFILALGSSNTYSSGSSFSLSTGLGASSYAIQKAILESQSREVLPESDGYGPQEILSAWLRASEDMLPYTEAPTSAQASFSHAKAMSAQAVSAKAAALGETEEFRVLSSLSSTTSYVNVTGKVRCEGTNVVFYVDTSVSTSILSDDDVNTLCNEFDTVAGDEQDMLGTASDVDGDGKVHILMTSQINRLGALGGGIITGYFYAGDLYAQSSSNSVSNSREIIYTMVPDPSGQYGTTISNSFAMSNLLPAVLPHELQHAISYNQHVFVQGGASEENWLNEGLSHLAEDLLGFGMENPSRYEMYLASPSTYGIVTSGSPNLMERGGEFLFLRFLYEQAANPAAFLKGLYGSTRRGTENVEYSFSGPEDFNEFSELFARWAVALAMTDRGISQDSRYNYDDRVRNASTGNWQGVCLSCDADDQRGTTLAGVNLNTFYGSHTPTLDASALTYYEISSAPSQIKLSGTQGGGGFGILIRTQ